MTRLAATDPAVAAALASIARQERDRLAVAAADMVLAETNQSPPRDPDELALTVETLDAAAWDLQEVGSPEYEAAFARARAVNSLLFALQGDVDEAIYEAIHASRTPDNIRDLVLEA